MLESGKRSLLLEAVTSALHNLAECYEILAKEHGKDSEKYTETLHEYGKALLEWARIKRDDFEHAMGGFEEETDLQNLQEKAQGLTTINAREEEQQKVANLMALKTPSRRGIPRCRRIPTRRTYMRRPRA